MKKLMACLALTPLYASIFWGFPYLLSLMVMEQNVYLNIVKWFHIVIIGIVLFFLLIAGITMLTSWAMSTLKGEQKIHGFTDEDD